MNGDIFTAGEFRFREYNVRLNPENSKYNHKLWHILSFYSEMHV